MKKLILFILACLPMGLFAQITISGTVTDAADKSALPYVNVYVKNSTQGTYTDIKGKFFLKLNKKDAVVVFSSIGYAKKEIKVTESTTLNIALAPLALSLEETIILPGENPADVIMRKVVDNRDKHNPENLPTFKYKSYNKFVVTITEDSLKSFNKDSVNLNDSVAVAKRDSALRNKEKDFGDTLLYDMNLFLMESVTEKKYKKPGKVKETVMASRISGLKNAQYVLLASEMQSFSFYSNYIKVVGKEYLSPITKGNTKKYLFILQDTVEEGGESVYLIYYQPRKGKNFEGLSGLLYINTKSFAVMKATATIADKTSGTETQVVQQYQKLKDDVYFPMQFTADFFFKGVAVVVGDSAATIQYAPLGKSKTILYDINLDNDFRRRDFDNVELEYAPDALEKGSDFWNANRQEKLTGKDSLTYVVIDSIGEELDLDRRIQFLRILQTKKLPIGPISIHLEDIIRFNNFEGVRLGMHASTNNRLSRRFSVGGYYAYGFKDVHSKYGGNFRLFLNKSQSSAINLSYSNDVAETGSHMPLQYEVKEEERYRELYISVMDRVERTKASINYRLLRYVTVDAGVEQVNKKVTTPYRFGDGQQEYFKFTNAVVSFRWAPGEKLVESFGRYRPISRVRSFVMHATVTKGFKDVYNGGFDFLRADVMADYKFRLRNLGHSSIRIMAGYVDGDVPYTEMYFGRAGYNAKNISIVTPSAFETMKYNEFFGNEYAAIFFRHSFGSLLLKTKNFKPEISLITNAYISNLSKPSLHKFYPLKPADKGFYESGLQIDRILKYNFATYGVGLFYRYGPYSDGQVLKNTVVKLSIGFSL